jgi:hypothetical protein
VRFIALNNAKFLVLPFSAHAKPVNSFARYTLLTEIAITNTGAAIFALFLAAGGKSCTLAGILNK